MPMHPSLSPIPPGKPQKSRKRITHEGRPELAWHWTGILFLLLWIVPAMGLPLDDSSPATAKGSILSNQDIEQFVARFNSMEDQNVTNSIPDAKSAAWLEKEIPRFDCPDPEVKEMYYYRWWSYRKHIEQTPDGYVLSEFLTRSLPGSSALGHQIAEGRWLHDSIYMDDYVRYWLRSPENMGQLHKYSNWLESALYDRYCVILDREFISSILGQMAQDYQKWEQDHLTPDGLFWQYDVRDGMEESISGSRTVKNLRPTINGYMYANARAIAAMAQMAGKPGMAAEFTGRANRLRQLVESNLWQPQARFYEVQRPNGESSGVREELGFIPWMFDLPPDDANHAMAWTQLTAQGGFSAPYGITTAEQRSPFFRTHGYGHCEWDGAVWPFATSQTLDALSRLLRDYHQSVVSKSQFYDAFLTYVESQHAGGKPYIGEYLDETTGQWINGKAGRSRYYNHSTFADLVITGVVGLMPRADDTLEVWPLLPDHLWDYFCLDDVAYHHHRISIVWDQDGRHYGMGKGLIVFVDGQKWRESSQLSRLEGGLP